MTEEIAYGELIAACKVEIFTDWLNDFLWHWQDSPILPDDAARAIMGVLLQYQKHDGQDSQQFLPDQEALLLSLKNKK